MAEVNTHMKTHLQYSARVAATQSFMKTMSALDKARHQYTLVQLTFSGEHHLNKGTVVATLQQEHCFSKEYIEQHRGTRSREIIEELTKTCIKMLTPIHLPYRAFVRCSVKLIG